MVKAQQNADDDAAHDDPAARLQRAETPALLKQPYDVTPEKFSVVLGIRHHVIAVPSQSILTQKITLSFLRLSGALFDTITGADSN